MSSLVWLARRHATETQNHQVELVLDLHSIEAQAQARDIPLEQLLASYREMGAAAIAVPELKLDDLVHSGAALPMRGLELRMALASGSVDVNGVEPKNGVTYLVFFDQFELLQPISHHLNVLFGERVVRVGPNLLEIPVELSTLRSQGLGFSPATVERLGGLGFSLWLRPENRPGLKPHEVGQLFQQMRTFDGVEGVIFGGLLNQALGYPDALEATAEELRQTGWKLGYIEIPSAAQQKGVESLVRELPERTVRLMAVSAAHQVKLSPFRVAAMYSLGARERNIRLLYVRPYPEPGTEEANQELFQLLTEEIPLASSSGTFPAQPSDRLLFDLLITLAAGAAVWLFLETFLTIPVGVGAGLAALLPAATLLFEMVGRGQTFRTLMALGAGCLFPLLAVALHAPLLEEVSQRRDLPGRLLGCSQLVWGVSLVSLAGAAMVAGLLHETTFWLGLDRFRGVKLLTLGVPLAAGLVVVARPEGRQKLREFASATLKFWHLLVGAAVALLGLVYVLRTGNDSGGTVTETERTVRVLLDQLMGVRPRFKEFLLAHPALTLTPAIGWLGYGDWLAIGVVVGAVGQAGMIDTFAHLHTPLWVSLIRSLLGLVIGWLVGLVGVVVVTRWQGTP